MPDHQVAIDLPEGKIAGIYADFVGVWHTKDIFTLDFGAMTGPPQVRDEGSTGAAVQTQAQIVARVRIPPGQAFEIMKALEQQLSVWEQDKGAQPGGPPCPAAGSEDTPPFPES